MGPGINQQLTLQAQVLAYYGLNLKSPETYRRSLGLEI